MELGFVVQKAVPGDEAAIVEMIYQLALYEKRPQDMTATAEDIRAWLFEKKLGMALLGKSEGELAAYALVYPVFSSFDGRGKLHVEDIVVKPEYRGKGFGKQMMQAIAALAVDEGYQGMNWSCLDWNIDAAQFYEGMGAKRSLPTLGFSLGEETMQAWAEKARTE